jgi:tetratricopeptide (TPR) repeat protein
MYYCLVLLTLLTSGRAWQAQHFPCGPSPEVRSELEKAANPNAAGPNAIDLALPPLAALRDRYPNDLFVNEAYQNAVQKHGILGYNEHLTEEYQSLDAKHPTDPVYHYLFLRSLLGRNTRQAITGLEEMVGQNPNFSPAIRTLAEIYDAGVFRDAEKEKSARERLAGVCPGSLPLRRLDAPPDKSPLLDQAERLLAEKGDHERVISMANQALVDEEWRGQLIFHFDWYSLDFKRQVALEIQVEYLKSWAIQVRTHREAGHPEKVDELLSRIESNAPRLRRFPGPAYWDALTLLANLYLEGKQVEQANRTLDQMRQVLVDHPNPEQAAALDGLRKRLATLPGS